MGLLYAQVSLDRSVVGSAGSDTTNGQLSLSMTLGEPIVATAIQGNLVLTQGFQQADVTGSVSIDPVLDVELVYRVFPNPTADKVVVRLSHDKPLALRLRVFDNLGRSVLPALEYVQSDGTHDKSLDLSQLAEGVYRLEVMEQSGRRLFSVSLEKR